MNDSFLNSANAPYVAELYSKYSQNPSSVDKSWYDFFSSLNENEASIIKGMKHISKNWKIWIFVIGLNSIAICGALYLKSIGIDLYAFRGGS